jgi:hypothetical protein
MESKEKLCFDIYEENNVSCEKTTCKQWLEFDACQNCTILAARNREYTLQEVGDFFGITRMRICQLEKQILKKINSNVKT